jgi:hypothetical protein
VKRKRRGNPADSPSSDNQLFAHMWPAKRNFFKEMAKLRHDGNAACSKKRSELALAAISLVIICM